MESLAGRAHGIRRKAEWNQDRKRRIQPAADAIRGRAAMPYNSQSELIPYQALREPPKLVLSLRGTPTSVLDKSKKTNRSSSFLILVDLVGLGRGSASEKASGFRLFSVSRSVAALTTVQVVIHSRSRFFPSPCAAKNQKAPKGCSLMAQAEGFEPPWACAQTVFKTASL